MSHFDFLGSQFFLRFANNYTVRIVRMSDSDATHMEAEIISPDGEYLSDVTCDPDEFAAIVYRVAKGIHNSQSGD